MDAVMDYEMPDSISRFNTFLMDTLNAFVHVAQIMLTRANRFSGDKEVG